MFFSQNVSALLRSSSAKRFEHFSFRVAGHKLYAAMSYFIKRIGAEWFLWNPWFQTRKLICVSLCFWDDWPIYCTNHSVPDLHVPLQLGTWTAEQVQPGPSWPAAARVQEADHFSKKKGFKSSVLQNVGLELLDCHGKGDLCSGESEV